MLRLKLVQRQLLTRHGCESFPAQICYKAPWILFSAQFSCVWKLRCFKPVQSYLHKKLGEIDLGALSDILKQENEKLIKQQ